MLATLYKPPRHVKLSIHLVIELNPEDVSPLHASEPLPWKPISAKLPFVV
jgi:hypothetical protein